MTRIPSKVYLYAWNEHSAGAKALAKELGIRRIKHEGSKWKPRPWKTVINWGASQFQPFMYSSEESDLTPKILNYMSHVRFAQNKLEAFNLWKNADNPPRVPKWTTSKEEAIQWIKDKKKVCARTVLNGHSGNGLVVTDSEESLPNAPLYVEYIPKKAEYRVHIVNGEVIDVQRKIRDPNKEPTNWEVRSHNNGFIFVRNQVVPPDDVLVQSQRAFLASGLDFGAVDVVWNEKKKEAYVLEINTAPGLEGQTVKNYAEAFRKLLSA